MEEITLLKFCTSFVLTLNFLLIYVFSGLIYNFVGIIYTALSIILTFLLRNTKYCYNVINILVRNWRKSEIIGDSNGNAIMLSAAFLIGSMKIGAAICTFVGFGAVIFLALAFLLACGFLFEGYKSGATISGAYYLAKILVKIYQFLNSAFDKIMELIVKIEFKALKIEPK